MNYRVIATFIGLLIVSCVYIPTQHSPFSGATTQFKASKTTGAEVAEIIRPYPETINTFNHHMYAVYQWKGEGIIITPFGILNCNNPLPIQKDKSPLDHFLLLEFDNNNLLVRFETVQKHVSWKYVATSELKKDFEKKLLSETWSIPSLDLTVDIDPLRIYWQNTHQPDAKKWLCEAADQHNPEALYRLGILYENGSEGLPKNLEMAYFWYRLGAEVEAPWWINVPESQNYSSDLAAKRIEVELTPEQRTNVEHKIRAWQPGECNQLLVPDISPH